MNEKRLTLLESVIRFCLLNKLIVFIGIIFVVTWGAMVAPFDWELGGLPRDPVPVDAIPDIGENQQIVFTPWAGRSPQDVEDQITYPMTTALLGIPKVKTIRSFSYFGFSSIYIIFDEDAEFYWSRSRVLEKINSLPASTLPGGVKPSLGPDATALGQIYWYTLEGQDAKGNPTGGWDPQELRTIQDWQVRFALTASKGIAEVASIGGFVKEYQIDVDPDAMRTYGVTLEQVFNAVRMSNVDVSAKTVEINRVEYFIRGLGFIKKIEDIEYTVVAVNDNVPVYIHNVATVSLGPAMRRGAIDKAGAEAVGGVAVVRYGFNPLEAIKNIKNKIEQISAGLPKKPVVNYELTDKAEVEKFAVSHDFAGYRSGRLYEEAWMEWLLSHPEKDWPRWITISQVRIVPFYDRTGLIHETLGTLNTALTEEILVTIIVVIMMLMHLRSSILISGLLPLAVLICFIAMKTFGVDANVVALSGIAIAIGTMVDMGVVICENIVSKLDEAPEGENSLETIFHATSEVGSAVLTAVATTVVSFLPVFTMQAAEGKLFQPLAYTKTFALMGSIIVAILIIPPLAHLFFSKSKSSGKWFFKYVQMLLVLSGVAAIWQGFYWFGLILIVIGSYHLIKSNLPKLLQTILVKGFNFVVAFYFVTLLAHHWSPLGYESSSSNIIFVVVLIGGLLGLLMLFQWLYEPILELCLKFKFLFLPIPIVIVSLGFLVWQDMGEEFMPNLDEGSFLLMPTTMPHASIGEAMDILKKQNIRIQAIPEVETVVGKIGRVDSSLDPAPVSMIESIISYKTEYISDKQGKSLRFKFNAKANAFMRDEAGALIPDENGKPFRQWRDKIKTASDIWDEIIGASVVPGTTSAPKLQPIAARIVMLQSGMRAPMGVKIYGPDLQTIEKSALDFEKFLKQVPAINANTVVADRVVGKPYLEIDIDRKAIARHGIHIKGIQDVIEVAIGGKKLTSTVEGRERFPVRVRYMRELRDQIETLGDILVPAPDGSQIPLKQLAKIYYLKGPMTIKSEDTTLVAYVVFDMQKGQAEVQVVEKATAFLEEKIRSGELIIPNGVSYKFSGNYENQIRAKKRLTIVLPLALFVIFLILYSQFKSTLTSLLIFSGVFVAWSGGFMMLWLYGQDWFLNFDFMGHNMRDLFHVREYKLSVAVWVGFLALFGIATDDGVILGTYLKQHFQEVKPSSIKEIRAATIHAGKRRIRPCMMTVGTTILALIPVLTSSGRGSDIMVPMAIPSFGGMTVVIITVFVVPTLYCFIEESKFRIARWNKKSEDAS